MSLPNDISPELAELFRMPLLRIGSVVVGNPGETVDLLASVYWDAPSRYAVLLRYRYPDGRESRSVSRAPADDPASALRDFDNRAWPAILQVARLVSGGHRTWSYTFKDPENTAPELAKLSADPNCPLSFGPPKGRDWPADVKAEFLRNMLA